jgi:NCS1 family nucleobase:cation symporter-1
MPSSLPQRRPSNIAGPHRTMAFADSKGGRMSTEGDTSSTEVGHSRPTKRSRFSLAVDQEPSSFAKTKSASNADFDPIPPSKRTWGTGSYIAYWMADAWAVSNWEVASSMIAAGLSWRMAIGACVLGNTIMGLVITVNGRIGATVSVVLT